MAGQRKLQRKQLIYYLKVIDKDTGLAVGRVVDVTREGIMLVSPDAVPSGKVLNLRLEMPARLAEHPPIDFEARSIWSSKDINPAFYDTGFQFVRISGEDAETIGELIDEFELPS